MTEKLETRRYQRSPMPPKGWKKPEPGAQAGAGLGQFAGSITDAAIMQHPQVGQQFQQPMQNISQVQQGADQPMAESSPAPGARKNGLSSHLDDEARGRIGAVNDVQIMCRSGLGRFDFKAPWLKEFPDAIPAGHLTPRLRDAIKAAGEIWINCKTRKVRNGEVTDETVDHSRHAALWLKEFV